jgi:hypothetical protein
VAFKALAREPINLEVQPPLARTSFFFQSIRH